jgi:excisionase family DNA binding protein
MVRPQDPGPKKVMIVREVAAYLSVHPTTIYRLLKRNQIPAFRIGSDWRFNVETIDHWRRQQEKSGN